MLFNHVGNAHPSFHCSPTSVDSRSVADWFGFDFLRWRPRNGIRVDFFFTTPSDVLVEGTSRVCVVACDCVDTSLLGNLAWLAESLARKNSVNSDVLERILLGVSPDIASGVEGRGQGEMGARTTRQRERPRTISRRKGLQPNAYVSLIKDREISRLALETVQTPEAGCHDVAVLWLL